MLKPEMFANFTIVTSAESTAVAVPESSVIYEGDMARVWVLQDDNVLALRNLTVGRGRDGLIEVLAGLRPDEKVVTSGTLFIDRAAQAE
jgi:cobalt-zinc-cadmium efflux system membrane fusion protein